MQYRTIQDNTRQYKTNQGNKGQYATIQYNTIQPHCKTIHDQDKTKQYNTKTIPINTRQERAIPRKDEAFMVQDNTKLD